MSELITINDNGEIVSIGDRNLRTNGIYFSLDDVIAFNGLQAVDINQIRKTVLKAAKGDNLYTALGIDVRGIHSLPPIKQELVDDCVVEFVRADLSLSIGKHITRSYGYLYGVTFGDGSAKLGCSEKPENRINTIKCCCDKTATSSVISIPIVYYRLIEQALHKKLTKRRIRGEWYVLGHDDVYQIIHEIGVCMKNIKDEQGPSIYFTDYPRNIANTIIDNVDYIRKLTA